MRAQRPRWAAVGATNYISLLCQFWVIARESPVHRTVTLHHVRNAMRSHLEKR